MTANSTNSKVLIIADPESERQVSLGRGFQLADRLGCRAHVVAFCHESLAALESVDKAKAEKARHVIMGLRRKSLKKQIENEKIPGLKVTSEIVWAKRIHEWVEQLCRRESPQVLVKTGHRTETFVYTPTDWHLIRDCPAPTLIVAEKKWRKTRPVLGAVDLATRSRSKQHLNEKVIEATKRYAKALDCPYYLLHVIHLSPVLTELDLIDEYSHTEAMKADLEPRVERLCRKHGLDAEHVLLKRGPVHKVITSEAARVRAQLLVLGTVGRSGARAKLIGNTAEKVLMLAHTDVLAVKP